MSVSPVSGAQSAINPALPLEELRDFLGEKAANEGLEAACLAAKAAGLLGTVEVWEILAWGYASSLHYSLEEAHRVINQYWQGGFIQRAEGICHPMSMMFGGLSFPMARPLNLEFAMELFQSYIVPLRDQQQKESIAFGLALAWSMLHPEDEDVLHVFTLLHERGLLHVSAECLESFGQELISDRQTRAQLEQTLLGLPVGTFANEEERIQFKQWVLVGVRHMFHGNNIDRNIDSLIECWRSQPH